MKKSHLLLLVMLLLTSAIIAQKKITGTVKDVGGVPMPGVNVIIKSTSNGTITDNNGAFTVYVPEQYNVITFSFIGMKAQDVEINDQTVINVVLEEESTKIDEVVAIGYGTVIKKSDLTGSVVSVKSEDIEKTRTVSALEGLQGRMAGVHITSESGEPGAGMSMVIRGGNSVSSDNQPLYVIDGVQIEVNKEEVSSGEFGTSSTFNPLASINPSDIESIEVLKDASATAVFGSRGANGVVIVTTKQGKGGRSTVSFDASTGLAWASKKLDVLNGPEYGLMRFERDRTNETYGEDTDGDGFMDQPIDFTDSIHVNWQDEAFRLAKSQNYNLSFSGGNDNSNYSTSFSYLDKEGIIEGTSYERYTGRLSVNQDANDYLRVGGSLNFSYSENNGAALNGGNGNFNGIIQSLILYNPLIIDNINETEAEALTTPYTMLSDAYKNAAFSRVIGNAYAEIKFNKNLNFRSTFGGTYTDSKAKEFYGKETSWGRTSNGLAIISGAKSLSLFSRNILNYRKTFNGVHRVHLQGTADFEKYNWENYRIKTTGYEIEATGVDDLSKALNIDQPATMRMGNNRMSYMSRLNYTLKDKYLITASFRADGSSRFADEHKWGYFPSFAIGWRMNQEAFMSNLSMISNAKLRLSAGATGNDRIPSGVNFNQAVTTDYASGGSISKGISPVYIAANDLRWETTWQYNAGIDLGFFNNRLTGTFDVYHKETTDLLLYANIPTIKGQARQWMNIGGVENRGIELTLSSLNINSANFKWKTDFNISANRNKILSLGDVDEIPVTIPGGHMQDVARLIVGESIGTAYGYVYEGIYQKGDFASVTDASGNLVDMEDVNWQNRDAYTFTLKEGVTSMAGRSVRPGDFKYKDLDGDEVVDALNDRQVISNSDPKHYGSITNTFNIKNFDFSFMFRWSYGNEVLNAARMRYEAGDAYYFNVSQDYWDGRWTENNAANEYGHVDNQGAKDVSSYYVEDASYLRLQNISLGYTLPRQLTQRWKIKTMRLYAVVDNLWVLTGYTGFDPEVNFNNRSLTGFDRLVYPRPTTLTMGLTVNF